LVVGKAKVVAEENSDDSDRFVFCFWVVGVVVAAAARSRKSLTYHVGV
jgi:hypothetical protein